MRRSLRMVIISVVAFIGIIVVASLATGGGHKTTVTTPPPASTAPAKPAPAPSKTTSERADLNYFKMDDRSVSGFSDIWVKFSVTNHSSKTSDYTINWQAVNANGTRVANSTELLTNVKPGQTATDAMPTTIPNAQATVTVTSLDRTEALVG